MDKKLKDLKVCDVIEMPLFLEYAENVLRRERALAAGYREPQRNALKVIDTPEDLGRMYLAVLNREMEVLSAGAREYIRRIGGRAYNYTMQALIRNEAEQDNGNRED